MLSLKTTGLPKAINRLDKFTGRFDKALSITLRQSARDVITVAKAKHRFISRTGNLVRSMKWDRVGKRQVDMFIDDVDAIYGKWQHNGTRRGITGDNFLERPWKARGIVFLNHFFLRFNRLR